MWLYHFLDLEIEKQKDQITKVQNLCNTNTLAKIQIDNDIETKLKEKG